MQRSAPAPAVAAAAASAGTARFAVQAKRETLPKVLEILKQVLREPLLPEDKFDEMKRAELADLEQSKTEPAALAANACRSLAPYSADDIRYVPTIEETIDRVKACTYSQVEQLYHDYLGSQHGQLSIVGDFDPDTCLPILKEMLAGWKATRALRPHCHESARRFVRRQTVDQHTRQSECNVCSRHAVSDVRRRSGLSGHGHRRLHFWRRSPFLLGWETASVKKKGFPTAWARTSALHRLTSVPALRCRPFAIRRTSTKLSPPSRKSSINCSPTGSLKTNSIRRSKATCKTQKVRRASDVGLAASLAQLSHEGRTMKFTADLERKIDALTPEQVAAAIRKRLHPENLLIVTAGDFKKAGSSAESR